MTFHARKGEFSEPFARFCKKSVKFLALSLYCAKVSDSTWRWCCGSAHNRQPFPHLQPKTGRCPQPHDERQDESDELRDAFGFPRRAHRRGGAARAGGPSGAGQHGGQGLSSGGNAHARGNGRAAGRRQAAGHPVQTLRRARRPSGHAPRRYAADRPHVRHAPGRPARAVPLPLHAASVPRGRGPDARRAARDHADGRRAHRPGGCGGRRRGGGSAGRIAQARRRCRLQDRARIGVGAARAARKLWRRAAVAPGGARCVPHVELRHARRADLRRRRAGRPAGVRPGHRQARPHPRRARRHRRGARAGGPAGLRDGP